MSQLRKIFWAIHAQHAHIKGIGGPGAPHAFRLDRLGDTGFLNQPISFLLTAVTLTIQLYLPVPFGLSSMVIIPVSSCLIWVILDHYPWYSYPYSIVISMGLCRLSSIVIKTSIIRFLDFTCYHPWLLSFYHNVFLWFSYFIMIGRSYPYMIWFIWLSYVIVIGCYYPDIILFSLGYKMVSPMVIPHIMGFHVLSFMAAIPVSSGLIWVITC